MNASHRSANASVVPPAAIPPARLWSGVLVAPAAWIAQGSLGWYFGYEACTDVGVGGARAALGLVSLAALACALTGWWLAWTNWGRTGSERNAMHIEGSDRVEYMAAGGVLVSSIFTIGIVWAGLSSLLLHECGGMR